MASEHNVQQLSDLVTFFTQYPILSLFKNYLTIADYYQLRLVCREVYEHLQYYLRTQCFNINVRLGDFVTEPNEFRRQLGTCGGLISGQFTLNFFQLSPRKVQHLDILIEDGLHADQFEKYMLEDEGYRIATDDGDAGMVARKPLILTSVRSDMTVRIKRTNGTPIHTLLAYSYDTASISFMTWNKAYSIFPKQTLIEHKLFPLRPLDDEFGSVLAELSHQGYTARDILWPDLMSKQTERLTGCRRVADQRSLVVALFPEANIKPPIPDYVNESCQFQVVTCLSAVTPFYERPPVVTNFPYPRNSQRLFALHEPAFKLSIEAKILKSGALRYQYTFASASWERYLKQRLTRWIWVEMYKLKPGNRPWQFTNGAWHISDPVSEQFLVPSVWDYADDQIPIWYQEWEAK